MSDERDVESLLEDRPELADAVETVLSVDEEKDTWTFDEVPLDSGTFGELVAHDIVDDAPDGNYHVQNREWVRAVIEGETDSRTESSVDISIPSVDRRTAGPVLGALVVVAAARLLSLPAVYRDGYIVLSGNDPYFYRYWVERLAASGGGLLSIASKVGNTGSLAADEPLLVTTLAWLSSLFGGSQEVTGHIVAWYPVVAGVITAALLYVFAVKATADRRVGLAAVLLLAVLPGHAMRTSLGFADHHAFDYVWLMVTALSLLVLLRDARDWTDVWNRRTAGATLLLGIGIAGQVLAWNSAVLLLAPVGLVTVVITSIDVADSRTPLPSALPIAAGAIVGTTLIGAAHVGFGWMSVPTIVAVAAIAAGTIAVAITGELWERADLDVRLFPVTNVAVGILGLGAVRVALPTVWQYFAERSERLFLSSDIAEAMSLFSFESFGFIFLLGFTLVLTLPAMVWVTARFRDDRRWAVPVTYGWTTFALASLQIRFVGEFAAFASLFAGLGFVWLAAWVDLASLPRPLRDDEPRVETDRLRDIQIPDWRTAGSLLLLFLLVGSLGIVQTPVKINQITTGEDQFRSAAFMDEYATDQGWKYPENYVFSHWSYSRMYNYFVNGHSSGYGYAWNNYEEFVAASNGTKWYQKLTDDNRAGFIITIERAAEPRTLQARLHNSYGSRNGSVPGLAHYRALYVAPGGTRKVFAPVEGARITGTGATGERVSLRTTVEIPGASFTYRRRTTVTNGSYAVTVPYPGKYTITTGDGEQTVRVSERAIWQGGNVTVGA